MVVSLVYGIICWTTFVSFCQKRIFHKYCNWNGLLDTLFLINAGPLRWWIGSVCEIPPKWYTFKCAWENTLEPTNTWSRSLRILIYTSTGIISLLTNNACKYWMEAEVFSIWIFAKTSWRKQKIKRKHLCYSGCLCPTLHPFQSKKRLLWVICFDPYGT